MVADGAAVEQPLRRRRARPLVRQMSCTETEFKMEFFYHGTGTPVPGDVLGEFNFQFVDFDQGLSRRASSSRAAPAPARARGAT